MYIKRPANLTSEAMVHNFGIFLQINDKTSTASNAINFLFVHAIF